MSGSVGCRPPGCPGCACVNLQSVMQPVTCSTQAFWQQREQASKRRERERKRERIQAACCGADIVQSAQSLSAGYYESSDWLKRIQLSTAVFFQQREKEKAQERERDRD